MCGLFNVVRTYY